MLKFFLKLGLQVNCTAGYKAIADFEEIMQEIGYTPLAISPFIHNADNIDIYNFALDKNNTSKTTEKILIVIQYPETCNVGLDIVKFIINIKKVYKNSKVILMIDDLDCIRYGSYFTTNKLSDINFINMADYIISQNPSMTELLRKAGVISSVVDLQFFDFKVKVRNVVNNFTNTESENKKTIVFGGNLIRSKSGFVYDLDQIQSDKIDIIIYGPNFSGGPNLKYMGVFLPDDSPNHISGDFGLLWEGNSLETCGGKIGRYLKFVTPHKLSLYIAAGIPVIIWSQAAAAPFIKSLGIGVTIDNLRDLENVVCNITNDEYVNMKNNVKELSEKVKKGYFSKKAFEKIENHFLNS